MQKEAADTGGMKQIEWIFFQDFRSYLVVCGQLVGSSKVSPPDKIADRYPGECSVPCGDEIPDKANPYGCGGWPVLTRTIGGKENQFGVTSPELTRKRKCNLLKCAGGRCELQHGDQYMCRGSGRSGTAAAGTCTAKA